MRAIVVFKALLVILPLGIAAKGCTQSSGGGPGFNAASAPAAGPQQRELNCEAKNGPTGCVDQEALARRNRDAGKSAWQQPQDKSETTARQTAQFGNFEPHMCKSIAQGGSGFFAFYGTLVTGQLGKLGDYCNELESKKSQSLELTTSPDTDQSGTWYCNTLDGSGAYGTYRMRENPRMDVKTCKKVSNN